MKSKKGIRVIEPLHHFVCGKCKKWWSVSGAPKARLVWHCPWCGAVNEFKKDKDK